MRHRRNCIEWKAASANSKATAPYWSPSNWTTTARGHRNCRKTSATPVSSTAANRDTKLLEQLSRFPAARLAIACDPRRSPDRGSLALIAELARSASATRVWLLQAPPGEALDAERLGDWHVALQQLELPLPIAHR